MKALVLLVSGLIVAAPAVAQDGGATGGDSQPTAARSDASETPAAERRICRQVEAHTGSRLNGKRKVCMTAREWRDYDRGN